MHRGSFLATLLLTVAAAVEVPENGPTAPERVPMDERVMFSADGGAPADGARLPQDMHWKIDLSPHIRGTAVIAQGTVYLTYAPLVSKRITQGHPEYVHITGTRESVVHKAFATGQPPIIAHEGAADGYERRQADKGAERKEEISKSLDWTDVELSDILPFVVGFAIYLRVPPHRIQKRRYGTIIKGKRVLYRKLQVFMGTAPYIGLAIQAAMSLWWRAVLKQEEDSIWTYVATVVGCLFATYLAVSLYMFVAQYELKVRRNNTGSSTSQHLRSGAHDTGAHDTSNVAQ